MSLKIRLLGSVDAEVDGLRVDLRGPRQSRLLALLALHPGEGVSTNTIIDAIWDGGELPAEPREALHTYVSRLRRSLGDAGSIEADRGTYALTIEPDAVDLFRFESAVAAALQTEGSDRARILDGALGLFRGPALSGFENEDWARAPAVRLNEMREVALDQLCETLVGMGDHDGAISRLKAGDRPRAHARR